MKPAPVPGPANAAGAIDFSRSAASRYVQLASLFRRRVESGQWQVGGQIPTVDELAAECQVARATVRQALDLLEAEKLIARYRAKGTFVIGKPQEQFWCEVASDWSGQLIAPDGVTIEILTQRERLSPAPPDPMVGSMAPFYQHWRRRHWRNGKPYYLSTCISTSACASASRRSRSRPRPRCASCASCRDWKSPKRTRR